MALEPNPITGKISLNDIAASMIETPADPASQKAGANQDTLQSAEADDVTLSDDLDPGNGTDLDDTGESLEAAEEGEDSLEAAEDDDATDDYEEDDETSESLETIELADDVLIDVTVDGVSQEVTLADLRRAYSGEGAIDKRVQEASEQRNAAKAERVEVQQELETGRKNLVKAFEAFDQMMFQPTIAKPDPALQTVNPQKYLLQSEAYRNEQADLAQKRQSVQNTLAKHRQQEDQKHQRARQENAARLVELMPDLRDPEKAKDIEATILEGARAYGFTEQEIGEVYDERTFRMAHDAAMYRRMLSNQKATPKTLVDSPKAKRKVLKPSATPRVKQATKTARDMKAKLSRARETGKAEDIAATLIVGKPRR